LTNDYLTKQKEATLKTFVPKFVISSEMAAPVDNLYEGDFMQPVHKKNSKQLTGSFPDIKKHAYEEEDQE